MKITLWPPKYEADTSCTVTMVLGLSLAFVLSFLFRGCIEHNAEKHHAENVHLKRALISMESD